VKNQNLCKRSKTKSYKLEHIFSTARIIKTRIFCRWQRQLRRRQKRVAP